jgi:hypothetical protein
VSFFVLRALHILRLLDDHRISHLSLSLSLSHSRGCVNCEVGNWHVILLVVPVASALSVCLSESLRLCLSGSLSLCLCLRADVVNAFHCVVARFRHGMIFPCTRMTDFSTSLWRFRRRQVPKWR